MTARPPCDTLFMAARMQTFLFTDIENSTALWQQFPSQMSAALEAHDAILQQAIRAHGGQLVKSTGDGVLAAFEQVSQAVNSATEFQQALAGHSWDETGPLPVRMGLHTGDALFRDNDYYGPAVNKDARVMALANGGQILLTEVTCALLRELELSRISFRELGSFRLKGLPGRTVIYQLVHPDLRADFPPLPGMDETPHNLPGDLTSFVGREREKERILQLLVDTPEDHHRARLVTLIGPGGTGKTRLSLEAARELRAAFPDGVWLIELAPLTEPEAIRYALLNVLGLQEIPGTPVIRMC